MSRIVNPLLSPFRKGSVVVFHIGRSGSTVLGDLLSQHSAIFWDGEIYPALFGGWEKQHDSTDHSGTDVDPTEYLRARMPRAGGRFYLFEVKPFHLDFFGISLPEYIQSLRHNGTTHFVVLERCNRLRKIVSSVIAREKVGSYHLSPGSEASLQLIELNVDHVRVDRDVRPLLAYLRSYDVSFRELDELLERDELLHLTYEEDIMRDPLVGYRRVLDFLGLDYQGVSVSYGRTNPFELAQMIENFDEVESVLQGTRFEWMLYE